MAHNGRGNEGAANSGHLGRAVAARVADTAEFRPSVGLIASFGVAPVLLLTSTGA